MRIGVGLLLVLAWAASLHAGDRPATAHPAFGLDGFDVRDPAHRDPARLQPLLDLGPLLARTRPIPWGFVEPAAPVLARPRYAWSLLDEAVLVWQLSGLDLVLVLSPENDWACEDPAGSDWVRALQAALSPAEAAAAAQAATGTAPPRADAWARWERYVRDLVERYDGDGQDDMPGLRRPVRHVQVLDRAASPATWLGDTEAYLRLLHHAGIGAKRAHADTRVLATGVDVRGTGHDPDPDAEEWAYRIGRLADPRAAPLAALEAQREFAFLRRLLDSARLFDVMPQVGSASHVEDVVNLRFLRRRLDEVGAQDVEVWLVDNPTRKLGPGRVPTEVRPDAEERRRRERWLRPALMPGHSEHADARRWVRRGQAYDVVRSIGRARAAGADAVLFHSPWEAAAGAAGGADDRRGQGFLADEPDAPPTQPLLRTPSFHALAQANRLLAGHTGAGESSLGAPGRSVVFTLADERARPWIAVLLLDERLGWGGTPAEVTPGRTVAVPLPDGRYRVLPLDEGAGEPRPRDVEVTHGVVAIDLTPAPVYVLPLR